MAKKKKKGKSKPKPPKGHKPSWMRSTSDFTRLIESLYDKATDGLCVWATLIFGALFGFIGGCILIGHVTNNFPPGRNEAGIGMRAVNDLYLYSDTGETPARETSSFGADIGLTRELPKSDGPPNPP